MYRKKIFKKATTAGSASSVGSKAPSLSQQRELFTNLYGRASQSSHGCSPGDPYNKSVMGAPPRNGNYSGYFNSHEQINLRLAASVADVTPI